MKKIKIEQILMLTNWRYGSKKIFKKYLKNQPLIVLNNRIKRMTCILQAKELKNLKSKRITKCLFNLN
jgi:hypothetical protein